MMILIINITIDDNADVTNVLDIRYCNCTYIGQSALRPASD